MPLCSNWLWVKTNGTILGVGALPMLVYFSGCHTTWNSLQPDRRLAAKRLPIRRGLITCAKRPSNPSSQSLNLRTVIFPQMECTRSQPVPLDANYIHPLPNGCCQTREPFLGSLVTLSRPKPADCSSEMVLSYKGLWRPYWNSLESKQI